MLRLIYSRIGEPHVGHSGLFSFNDPQGMCPGCEGMGRISTVDVDAMVDRSLSLNAGAIMLPNFGVNSWGWRMFAESGSSTLRARASRQSSPAPSASPSAAEPRTLKPLSRWTSTWLPSARVTSTS